MVKVIGIMSGTSLDGLDIAYCHFDEVNTRFFKIVKAKTIEYPKSWISNLKNCENANARELAELDTKFAGYCANQIILFLNEFGLARPEIISFHGHTIFHRSDLGYTFQLGSGSVLAALSKINTISDFRSANVALGGQGAPLVPIGDLNLFHDYEFCLNLGGFANISLKNLNNLTAFDICPANMALNELAQLKGLNFDENGNLAKEGNINPELLSELNALSFYAQKPPKSLGREWYLDAFKPIIDKSECSVYDKLKTVCEHIAIQIANAAEAKENFKMLVTGGGAKNAFLMQRIKHHFKGLIEIPSNEIIDFKEALIFAYLGYLRLKNQPNCLATYTGASKDICAGTLHLAY
jgi:anhydro-N-acetylmuramic acid kinase